MIIYGRNPVREAICGPRSVELVWATKNALREQWLERSGVELRAAGAEEIERRCGSPAHQGICAEAEPFRYADLGQVLSASDPFLVALDQVQDPQNLGSICRTAECAGATAVVIPERRSAQITAAVCKASAGAVEHLPVARVANLADSLQAARDAAVWCYGADVAAPVAYDSVDYGGPVAIVLGSEGRGIRPRVAAACDALISIPIRGRIGSLNVSAAAAVLLYTAAGGRAGTPRA